MIIGRCYLLGVLVIVVAALTCFGLAHAHTKHTGQQSTEQATSAAQTAQRLADQKREAALLANILLTGPVSLTPASDLPTCRPAPNMRCLVSPEGPRAAILPAVAAARAAGLTMPAPTCRLLPPASQNAKVQRHLWCNTFSLVHNGLTLTIVAGPRLAQSASSATAVTVSGSVVSINTSSLP